MKIKKDFNLDLLVKQYGFKKKEDARWYLNHRTEYLWVKEGRRKESILIYVRTDGGHDSGEREIMFSQNAGYYYDDIPDVIMQMIKDGIVIESKEVG